MGHERRFGGVRPRSAHHPIADMTERTAIGRKVPVSDMALGQSKDAL